MPPVIPGVRHRDDGPGQREQRERAERGGDVHRGSGGVGDAVVEAEPSVRALRQIDGAGAGAGLDHGCAQQERPEHQLVTIGGGARVGFELQQGRADDRLARVHQAV